MGTIRKLSPVLQSLCNYVSYIMVTHTTNLQKIQVKTPKENLNLSVLLYGGYIKTRPMNIKI